MDENENEKAGSAESYRGHTIIFNERHWGIAFGHTNLIGGARQDTDLTSLLRMAKARIDSELTTADPWGLRERERRESEWVASPVWASEMAAAFHRSWYEGQTATDWRPVDGEGGGLDESEDEREEVVVAEAFNEFCESLEIPRERRNAVWQEVRLSFGFDEVETEDDLLDSFNARYGRRPQGPVSENDLPF